MKGAIQIVKYGLKWVRLDGSMKLSTPLGFLNFHSCFYSQMVCEVLPAVVQKIYLKIDIPNFYLCCTVPSKRYVNSEEAGLQSWTVGC